MQLRAYFQPQASLFLCFFVCIKACKLFFFGSDFFFFFSLSLFFSRSDRYHFPSLLAFFPSFLPSFPLCLSFLLSSFFLSVSVTRQSLCPLPSVSFPHLSFILLPFCLSAVCLSLPLSVFSLLPARIRHQCLSCYFLGDIIVFEPATMTESLPLNHFF